MADDKYRFEVIAEIQDLLKKLEQGGDAFGKFEKQGGAAVAKVSGELKNAEKSASSFGDIFKGTFLSTAATAGLSKIGSLVGSVAKGMIDGNAQMESYKTQFEVMLGSADKATKMFEDLTKMGASTPFEFTDLAAGTQKLLAFGRAQGDILPDLQMLGDISGGNAQKLETLTLAFGKVSSSGKLSGEELNMMIDVGFNPLNSMAEKTGKSMAELRKDMEGGKISFADVQESMKAATSEGGKFYGMMEKQSQTFTGLLSTLKDGVSQMLVQIGGPLFNALKPVLKTLTDIFANPAVQAGIKGITEALGGALVPIFNTLSPILVKLLPVVASVLQVFSSLVGTVLKALQPLLPPIVSLFERLAPIFQRLGAVAEKLVVALAPVIDMLVDMLADQADQLVSFLDSLITILEAMTPLFPILAQGIKISAGAMLFLATGPAKLLVGALAWIVEAAKDVVRFFGRLFEILKSVASAIYDAVVKPITDALSPVSDALASIGTFVSGLFDKVAAAGKAFYNAAIKPIVDGVGSILATAGDAAAALSSLFWGKTAAESAAATGPAVQAGLPGMFGNVPGVTPAASGGSAQPTEQPKKPAAAAKGGKAKADSRPTLAELNAEIAIKADELETENWLANEAKKEERAKELADAEKARNEIRLKDEERLAKRFADIQERAFEAKRKQWEKESKAYAENVADQRKAFEDRFASPIAQLGGDLVKSVFDPQVKGADRVKMAYEGLGNLALSTLTQIATEYIKNALMSVATTLTLIPAQVAAATATAAAWTPAATMASLATFGANAAPAMAGIGSTMGFAKTLSLLQLDQGAVVTQPTIAMIAEKRPEFVGALDDLVGIFQKSVGFQEKPAAINKRRQKPGFSADVRIGVDAIGRGGNKAAFRRQRRGA